MFIKVERTSQRQASTQGKQIDEIKRFAYAYWSISLLARLGCLLLLGSNSLYTWANDKRGVRDGRWGGSHGSRETVRDWRGERG